MTASFGHPAFLQRAWTISRVRRRDNLRPGRSACLGRGRTPARHVTRHQACALVWWGGTSPDHPGKCSSTA